MQTWIQVLISCLVLPVTLSAYKDPPGDKKPTVIVRDGQFVVRFEGFTFFEESPEECAFEIVFSPEGKLITPRRKIDFDFYADDRPGAPPKKHPPTVWFKPQNAEDPHSGLLKPGEEIKVVPIQQHQAFWVENPYDEEKRTETALPLAPMGQHLSAEKVSERGDQIAIVWADNEEFHADEVSLHFSLVSKVESKKGLTVHLGTATALVASPTLSEPLWVQGRWWIAWLRIIDLPGRDVEKRVRLTLTSIDPKTEKVEHQEIHDSCYWHGYISMQVIEDRLCLAWNSPMMTPPYFSQIYMAFEKLAPGALETLCPP